MNAPLCGAGGAGGAGGGDVLDPHNVTCRSCQNLQRHLRRLRENITHPNARKFVFRQILTILARCSQICVKIAKIDYRTVTLSEVPVTSGSGTSPVVTVPDFERTLTHLMYLGTLDARSVEGGEWRGCFRIIMTKIRTDFSDCESLLNVIVEGLSKD